MTGGSSIQDGDLGWLAAVVLPETELKVIHDNQDAIEKALGNLSLREIAKDETTPRLETVLGIYLTNSGEVAKSIVAEAKFWESKLKGTA